jgi:hypothetical protein
VTTGALLFALRKMFLPNLEPRLETCSMGVLKDLVPPNGVWVTKRTVLPPLSKTIRLTFL